MDRKMLPRVLLVSVIVITALGCNFVTNLVEGAKTVATGQAIITQMDPEAIVSQVGAIVTEIDPAEMATQMAPMVTQMGAMITDMAPMTTQMGSMITEMAPLTTQMAPLTTEMGISSGDAPADIPIMEGTTTGLVATAQSVSYFINADLNQALTFYQTEMPKNGWTQVESGSRVGESDAELHFEKDGRKAIVILATIPFVNQTTVVITIE